MKFKNILSVIALTSVLFPSCDDEIMEWKDIEGHGEVTTAELPLPLAEKIERYEPLKTYTDLILGLGLGAELYINEEVYGTIANENFDELTAGYAMKHGPMVNSSGELNFETADAFVSKARAAGLNVFGHTLIWHTNQNASYLNSLLAPTVIPGASGSNSLDLSGLKDGSLSGWDAANPGDGISVEDGEGLSSTTQAVKMVAGASASNPWNLQLISPDIPVVSGHNYEVSFYVKSDQPGQGRISFSGLSNNYPWHDWYATGGSYTEAFDTTSEWQQVKFPVNDFTGTTFKMNFDMGYLPGVTYYIDVNTLSVVDLDAQPESLITNGDFEDGTINPWGGWGNGSTRDISANGEGYGDTGYAMVLTNPVAANNYSAQQVYTFSQPLEEGKEYTCSFMVKATTNAALQVEVQSDDYSADYYGGISVGTAWTEIVRTITPSTADRTKFIFDFGETATTFYIDNVSFIPNEGGGGSEPTIIEKTDEEKAEIIETAMEDWISKMVDHYKNDVFAWDVVNEPMKEDGTLRDGNVTELADDEFYWVKYLGKDYAVKAFTLARQYGNATDKLFINDYNLESRLDKCDGLIEYVNYIESQGAQVDGIGTQMHVSLNTDKDNIVEMFKKLAASGKLIKVSELDVRLGTANPTPEQLLQQSDMYQFIIDKYIEHIPASQQHGITIWSMSDNEIEHEYWLPGESPNLWDANYQRKPAYMGVANGLAGRDVSEDFSGELIID